MPKRHKKLPLLITVVSIIAFIALSGCKRESTENASIATESRKAPTSSKNQVISTPTQIPTPNPATVAQVSMQVDHLIDKGRAFKARFEIKNAGNLFLKALNLAEVKLGSNHQKTVLAHNELARFYRETGRHDLAEPHLLCVVEATQNVLGNQNSLTADMYDILGNYYFDNGRYALAEPHFKKALGIRLTLLGESHTATGTSFQNMGMLYGKTGRYGLAEQYYKRVLQIDEKNNGKMHLNTASALNNIAILYRNMNRLDEAEVLFNKSLSITESILGKNHPFSATVYDHLALLYSGTGRFSKAIRYHKKALAILREKYGESHPEIANIYNNLALSLSSSGDLVSAEKYYGKALKFSIQKLGKYHPNTQSTLTNLLFLYWRQERWKMADKVFHAVRMALTDALRENLNIGISGEGMQLLSRYGYYFELLVSYGLTRSHIKETYDMVSSWKGLAYESAVNVNQLKKLNPAVNQVYENLSGTLAELSSLVNMRQSVIDPRKKRHLEEAIAQKQGLAEEMERHLNSLSYNYRNNQKLLQVDSGAICRAVPTDQALVDIIRYRPLSPNKKTGAMQWDEIKHYAAFVVTKNNVKAFDLGSAADVDQRIEKLRHMIDPQFNLDVDSAKTVASINSIAHELYQLAFAPYESLLKEYEIIQISPDGLLATVPFGVFVDHKSKYLIESYAFSYIASARQLLRKDLSAKGIREALVVGDPDFDLSPAANSGSRQVALGMARGGAFSADSPKIDGLPRFTRLPETADEARSVAGAFEAYSNNKTKLLLGPGATEDSVKSLSPGKGLLYFSTHGYFRASQQESTQISSSRTANVTHEQHYGVKVNPLHECGIVLASANNASETVDPNDDGFLTGAEIIALDLEKADLVILAACVTGLGEVREGQGLMGLRYAFNIAGANTVVASSWHVPSAETKEFMERLMPAVLMTGNCAREVQRVKLHMIQTSRKEARSESPFYWGSFTCSGIE